MESLTFYVQGSGKDPYKITTVGSGTDFQLNCSCPAGRSKVICKHIAFLLQGDVTNMVSCSPAGAMARLRVLSANSMQLRAASSVIDRNLARQKMAKAESRHDGLDTIEAVYEAHGIELSRAGWDVRVEPLNFPRKGYTLGLHGSYRRGRKTLIYVSPSISLIKATEEFHQEEWDWSSGDLPPFVMSSESNAKGEWKLRPYPWTVKWDAAKKTRSFRNGPKAIEFFWECVRKTKPSKE